VIFISAAAADAFCFAFLAGFFFSAVMVMQKTS